MDITKVDNAEKVRLCKKYFYIGLFFLPFVWVTNFFWFFQPAYRWKSFPEQKILRKYTTLSIIGALLWGTLLLTWNILFQYFRTDYAQYTDYLSFVFPVGYL
uniref:Gamma-secretase subunit PEN-2 n=1 Tax=Panagrellus redivivus TaxID=6233 RepID=A0A7E4VL14_PANRE